MFCSNCGELLARGAKFCPKCGISVRMTNICPNCNAEVALDAVFCMECGTRIHKTDEDLQKERRKEQLDKEQFIRQFFVEVRRFDGKSILVKKKDVFSKGSWALILIRDMDELVVSSDNGTISTWAEFLEENFVKKENVIFLSKKAVVFSRYFKNTIYCYNEWGNIFKYVFQEVKGKVYFTGKDYDNCKVYDFLEGRRYFSENQLLLDSDGNVLWEAGDSDANSNGMSWVMSGLPAPYWACKDYILDLSTGNELGRGLGLNLSQCTMYKDTKTKKKILEERLGTGFGMNMNTSYTFYEVKYDQLIKIENMFNEKQSLGLDKRFEKLSDSMYKYQVK